MNPPDIAVPQTEDQIPMLAAMAIERAYRQALAAGQHVLVAESGVLIDVAPDGTRRVVKQLEPNISVTVGQVITLQ
jgi:hypothetical protein